MPDGSLRPPPPPPPTTSTAPIPTNTTTSSSLDSSLPMPSRSFPLAARRLNSSATAEDLNIMKSKIFGSAPTSPTTARPRTGHQSVRGRISGPIPIPNPLDDDEFPIRNPGTGIASSTPIEHDLVLQRPPQPVQSLPPAPSPPVTPSFAPNPLLPPPPMPVPVAQTFPAAGRADVVEVPQTVPELPGTPTKPPSSAAGLPGPSPEGGLSTGSGARSSTVAKPYRMNPSSTARYSTVSASSEKTSASNGAHNGPPQRKKSTLRSAIGRLLRRKKKDGSLSSVSETERQSAIGGPPPQHRSVPPAARSIPDQNTQQTMRVTSMPISEFDRALRSHSIGPDDINAIESARNSVDVLGSSPLRKRAATATQSRIITGGVPRSRGEEWAGLSPRPASTHARGSRLGDDDPDAIGRAITSDSNGDVGHKRRSRSLSQLNEVALEAGDGRRRSDEIRYWRQSYDIPAGPQSPLSSAPNEDDIEHNDAARPSMSIADSSAERIPKTPPQPFNFGSLASMNEMAGMKITQAASLDDRFGHLEARMSKLERVVNQLCHSVPGFKGPFTDVSAPARGSGGRQRSGSASASAGVPTHHVSVAQPTYAYSNAISPMIPHIYHTGSPTASRDGPPPSSRYSITDDNASSRVSMENAYAYMDSLHPPSSSATQAVSTVATSVPPMRGLLRPTSEATVRPATSMPSLGSQGSNSGEERSSNSAALLAQLDSERAARQLLEDQVRKLSERMNNLSTTMFAMVRDPAKSKSQERLRPQTAGSGLGTPETPHGNAGTLSVNTTAAGGGRSSSAIAPSSKAQSIFGREAVPGGLSLAGSPSKDIGEDDFSEAFQTPREEVTPGLGSEYPAFGDEFGAAAATGGYAGQEVPAEEEDEEARKKAARVLSLSQLTMGKGLPTRI